MKKMTKLRREIKSNFHKIIVKILFAGILLFIASPQLMAEGAEKANRQKVIDFEGDLVEGVNKRPLDSLSQISDGSNRHRKPHLYRKRQGFRTETTETLREMRYLR